MQAQSTWPRLTHLFAIRPVLTSTKFSRKPSQGPYKVMFKAFACNVSRGSQEADAEDTTLGSVAFEAPLAWELGSHHTDGATHTQGVVLEIHGHTIHGITFTVQRQLIVHTANSKALPIQLAKAKQRCSDRPNNPSLVECNMA